jgi:hypothetical protein
MARRRSETNETLNDNHDHFPPERIIRMLQGIKSAIGLAESRAISFEYLEQLSGRPVGTIAGWFEGAKMNQLEFFLALLERVPTKLRHELIDGVCRIQPTLRHLRLAHDPIATSRLEAILKRRAGFTIIHGGPEHARTFLLNALGNSTREINFGHQAVVGVEIQSVSGWAPVPGIIHLSHGSEIQQQLLRAWAEIKQVDDGSLVLLGHVWARLSDLHSEIVHLAQRCHVLLADEFPKPEDMVRRVPGQVHILTVAPAREQPEWIRVTVQRG